MHSTTQRAFGITFPFLVLAALSAANVCAADHFLAIGGGDSPSNNQVSLEKNILFFQRLLCDSEGAGIAPDVLFSDGPGGSRDIQFVPAEDPPRLNLLMSRLFNQE